MKTNTITWQTCSANEDRTDDSAESVITEQLNFQKLLMIRAQTNKFKL